MSGQASERARLRCPCLILVMGVAGVGKTTLSQEIAGRLAVTYLDNNLIADPFMPKTRRGARYEALRPHFYEVLYSIAAANLRLGNSVLLDVPHVKEAQFEGWSRRIKGLAEENGAQLTVLKCRCSEAILRERLRARGEERDWWKLRNWADFLAEEPIDVAVPLPHLILDTEEPLSKLVGKAVEYVVNECGS